MSIFSDSIINKTEVFGNTYNIEMCANMNCHELKGKVSCRMDNLLPLIIFFLLFLVDFVWIYDMTWFECKE